MPRVMKLKYPPERLIKLVETKWRQPELGEIFCFSVKEGEYMYGRVIHTEPNYGFPETSPNDVLLVYIYKKVSKIKLDIPTLKKEDLLIMSIAGREIWQWGYFETLKQRELEKEDFYLPICFNYDHLVRYNFKDENGKFLDKEYYPCIKAGFPNIHGVQSKILRALGEPLPGPKVKNTTNQKNMPKLMKLKYLPKRLLKITEENHILAQTGDVFAFSVHEGKYMYGKVIGTDVDCGFGYPDPLQTILIYMYDYVSNDEMNIPKLKKEDRLGIALFVKKEMWMWGYFKTLKNSPVLDSEIYKPLCFEYLNGKYYDEKGNLLKKRYKGFGRSGSTNVYGVESEILRALGEPLPGPKVEKESKKTGFDLYDTNGGFDFTSGMGDFKGLEDVYMAIDNDYYFQKDGYIERDECCEAMVAMQVLLEIISGEKLIEADEDRFEEMFAFIKKFKKSDVDMKVFRKGKKLLKIIGESDTSELKALYEEAGLSKDLEDWIQKRLEEIDLHYKESLFQRIFGS